MKDEHLKNKATAQELAELLDDQKNIGFYYRLAEQNAHSLLIETARNAVEYPNVQNKGKIFTWLFKNLKAQIAIATAADEDPKDDRILALRKRALQLAEEKGMQ